MNYLTSSFTLKEWGEVGFLPLFKVFAEPLKTSPLSKKGARALVGVAYVLSAS